ncbi:MAG: NRDE family protein [Myxococcota bacterium]
MCTLIALHRCIPDAPLVIAANRDEFLDRPSEGPALRRGARGRILAPADKRAGGTWMGVSDRGVFAALTNRRCPEPDPTRKSRGYVVLEALEADSAREAAERLARLPSQAFNPFNAFVADARDAFALVYQDEPCVRPLSPGAHVVGNVDPDATDVPKVARVLGGAREAAALPLEGALERLRRLCGEHEPGPASLDDTCIHLDRYGTRSSALMVLGERVGDGRFWFADGPPCRREYEDFTPLLCELSQRARYVNGDFEARTAS